MESLGWEGPLKLIRSCEEQGHLHRVAEGEHFQGYVKHSRLGTAAGGEDLKAEPQQCQELWVTFPGGQETPRQLPRERGIGKIPHSLFSSWKSFPEAGIK